MGKKLLRVSIEHSPDASGQHLTDKPTVPYPTPISIILASLQRG